MCRFFALWNSFFLFDVCETVHHYNNDVSNQKDATIFAYLSFY